ncbi:hypothetical protein C8R47DRAFT_444065 [Mycena vitilis]|nr:hypothetical protein C8R47DRAFT_444065 [Mycena vitilis]
MSRISANNGITEKRFANMPAIPGHVLAAVTQALASDGASTKSGKSGVTHFHTPFPREEGCFVTHSINYANELAHFVAAIRAPGRETEKERLITALEYEYNVVSGAVMGSDTGFDLEHESNRAWLSPIFHKHHNLYASIAIVPSLPDLIAMEASFTADNQSRQRVVDRRKTDPGRRKFDDFMQLVSLTHQFELIVLHPAHFVVQGETVKIYRNGVGVDYHPTLEGILADPDGVPLAPFSLRTPRADAASQINPLLPNFAAAIRFRRFRRTGCPQLGPHANNVMDASLALWNAIIWKPTKTKPTKTLSTVETKVEDASTSEHQTQGGSGTAGKPSISAETADVEGESSPMETSELMMEYLLGGYEFQTLPDLIADDGSTPSSRSTTPTDATEATQVPKTSHATGTGEMEMDSRYAMHA